MSVQAGEWNFDGEPVGRERLSRISHTIMEYGPDGESMHVLGNMGILYRAFHTTPHSRLETQPHVCDDGVVITWDGRLDNRAELIAQLRGSVDAASTDVAIVAAAFRKAGVRSFSQLIGDWALSIWNPRELELILARDYIGVRHLFYHLTRKRITWCSLMSPLVLSGECFTLCNEYIAGYLSFYPDADLTPYSEIRSVPPGKFIRVHDGNTTVGNHWKFSPGLKTRCKTDAEYEEQYRCLFGQAVRRRLYSDSVILAELSGGLDSSAIVCMADELSKQQPANAPRIDTFSYFDCDEPYEDDHRYFIKVEEQRGRAGHHAAIRGTGDTFPISCSRFVPTPGFGERLEIQSARKDIVDRHKYRVVLSGQGGDEVNGQALDVRVQIADCLARFHFSKGGSQLLKWCLDTKYPLIHLLGESLSLLLPREIRVGTNVANVWPWINSDFARQYSLASRALTAAEGKWFWKPSVRDAYQTIINFGREVTFHRPTVPEKRYPYLDQTLVEFLLSIPTDQVLRPANRRSLMRRALSHLLPSEILHRRSKAGTGRCIAFTVTKHWTEVHNLLVSPISSRLHIIDEAALRAQMESIKHGQLPSRVAGLLKVLSLEVWLRNAEAHGVLSPSTSASARAEPYLSESIAS